MVEEMEKIEVMSEESEGEEVRILVVDDSPVDRMLVERLLKKSGSLFQVITVDSAKKAMEVLGLSEGNTETETNTDQKIDVILSDYCMPEMTGYDLLKAIKEHSSQKPIPVIIMSSENEPQRISSCRALGAEDFIIKPLQAKDVQRLRNYASSTVQTPKSGIKRNLPVELMSESSGSAKRTCLTGLAVA